MKIVSVDKKKLGWHSTSEEDIEWTPWFLWSPKTSLRHASLELQIPKSTVCDVLHETLNLRAYKMQLMQHIIPDDRQKRYIFVASVLESLVVDNCFFNKIMFSDEAVFYISAKVNRCSCQVLGLDIHYEHLAWTVFPSWHAQSYKCHTHWPYVTVTKLWVPPTHCMLLNFL